MFKELELDQSEVALGPREMFLRAKAEMYYNRAAEALDSYRYHAALTILETVTAIGSHHLDIVRLQETAIERLKLFGRVNGEPNANTPGPRRPETILIVDQDVRVLRGLGSTFRTYGFNVIGAESYEEGIDAIEFSRPKVIVSEVNFETGPVGIDLFQHALSTDPGRAPVFVFVANRIDRDLEITGRKAGVDHFVLKPFDNDVVATTVLSFLTRRSRAS